MQAQRFLTGTATFAAILFTLAFSSCNKDDSSSNPTNPPGTLSCRPSIWKSNGRNQHSYEYINKKLEIDTYLDNGSGQLEVTDFDYEGDNIIVRTVGGNFIDRYVVSNGRFSHLLRDYDSTFYRYNAAHQLDWIETWKTTGSLERLSTKHITYRDGLPYMIADTTRLWPGQVSSIKISTTTYDTTHTVAFNPFNEFMIGPGIDIIKVNRVPVEINYKIEFPDMPSSNYTYTETLLTIYNTSNGNPNTIAITSTNPSFPSATNFEYEYYPCD